MKILLRFLGFLFAAGTILFIAGIAAVAGLMWHFSKDLPEYTQLQNYEPPVMTRVHASDGSLLAEYANERRLYLPIQAIPKLVTNAFIAAEDKNFYEHPGVDVTGIGRAAMVYIQNYGGGRRPQGASTITQQVAKNFLLTNELSMTRKIKEALLALRIERSLFEGQDPRALSQPDLSRARRLRRRRGFASLFRQIGARTDDRRGGLSRRVAEGPEQLQSVPPPRRGNRAAQLRHRPHGRRRLHRRQRRRQGQEGAAERRGAPDRRAHLRGRIFRRRGPPLPLRELRREEALRRRPLRAHHARPEDAGAGAQDHDRRARQFRRDAGLPRPDQQDRDRAATGASSSPTASRCPTSIPGGLRSCSRSTTSRRVSACSRRAIPEAPSSKTAKSASCRSTA